MRIVITGGTGMIGRPLVSSLADDGHELIVLSRHPEKQRPAMPANVALRRWDGSKETAEKRGLESA